MSLPNTRGIVADYGRPSTEYSALWDAAGFSDLSYRGRLCILGADRAKFLNGQVTNNVKDLHTGQGCHAALVSAKGKIQSDLHIYALENELLLEFEPGLAESVAARLEKYIIAEDAQIADVAEAYGLWTVQGPQSAAVLKSLPWNLVIPVEPNSLSKFENSDLGEIYVVQRARSLAGGFDLFVPRAAMSAVGTQLAASGAQCCGWQALETARIEAGLPRFGIDMDETNLAPEILDTRAISYAKGCYIGQEVIARVRTYGQVAKVWRGMRLPDYLSSLPAKGDKLFMDDKEVGQITSAAASPRLKGNIALGYVRREANQIGTELILQTSSEKVPAKIVELPFSIPLSGALHAAVKDSR